MVGHKLPKLAICGGIPLRRPVEGMAHFERDAGSIVGGHERGRIQANLLGGGQDSIRLEPAHNHDVRSAREPVVGARSIVQVVGKDHGCMGGIHFVYPHTRERALDRA